MAPPICPAGDHPRVNDHPPVPNDLAAEAEGMGSRRVVRRREGERDRLTGGGGGGAGEGTNGMS